MRILVADGNARVRHALVVLLDRQEGLQLLGEASDWSDLLLVAADSPVDLVLVDLDLPGLRAGGGLAALRARLPLARIVALSGQSGARRDALAAGADGFISKGDAPGQVLATLRNQG
jgi:DNA-binding NarL/FixJ family response regulator